MTTLAQDLKKYRKLRGLTQLQLANIINVTPQAIASWEAQRRVPRLQYIEKLAKAFNITVGELADNDDTYTIKDIAYELASRSEDKTKEQSSEYLTSDSQAIIERLDTIITLLKEK